MIPFQIPDGLLSQRDRDHSWASWLESLPRLVRDVVDDWALTFDGSPMHGSSALVVAVRTSAGSPAVLKLAWPHPEQEHEHLALQAWHGNGAVKLLRADPHHHAMLLERLHAAESLDPLWDIEACEVVAGLYGRLHVRALPQLRTLSSYVARWVEQLGELPKDGPVPRRLVDQTKALDRSFLSDDGTDGVMIHGDLHYDNVLAGDREPWLVIDPKPMSGDPHYEVAPMLWNRWPEVVESGHVRDAVRRRFHTLIDTAELDEDRARDWVVVRMVHNAMWAMQGAQRPTPEQTDVVTRCIAVAKAVQG